MRMNDVKLHLPKLSTVKLGDLHKGIIFMFARDHYSEYTPIYMVLKNDYSKRVETVNLTNGDVSSYGSNTQVVELDVTIHCEPHDDSKLPF